MKKKHIRIKRPVKAVKSALNSFELVDAAGKVLCCRINASTNNTMGDWEVMLEMASAINKA